MRLIACLLLWVPLFALAKDPPAASPEAESSASSPAEVPAVGSDPSEVMKTLEVPDDPVRRLDALFDQRGDAGKAQEHEKLLTEALRAQPDSFELLMRGARWKIWMAEGATGKERRSAIAKEGWVLADKARALQPQSALAHYYASASVGIYAQGIGILSALGEGIEGKFNERLDRALALDPTVDHAGPWMSKGRYHYELPWPMRDLGKSRALLEKAVARFPQNTRAHLYLAETLHREGKQAEARAELKKALTLQGVNAAEAQRVRELAKHLEQELNRM